MLRSFNILVLATLTAACVDRGAPREAATGPIAGQQMPLDPAINTNDTYVLFDADVASRSTIAFTQPITDPATGQQVSELVLGGAPDSLFHIEAGYDANGILRVTATGRWSPTGDTLTARIPDTYRFVLSNGQLYSYDAAGAEIIRPTTAELGDSIPPMLQVLTDLGDDLFYGNVSSVGVVDSLQEPTIRASSERVIAQSGTAGGRVERHYERTDQRWSLSEIRFSDERSTPQARLTAEHRLLLRNVFVHTNAVRDAWRAQRNAGTRSPAPAVAALDATALPPEPREPAAGPDIRRQQCYEEQCFPEGGGGGTPPPPPVPPPAPPPPPPRNVAFQHGMGGIGGPSGDWARMTNWLTPLYRFGTRVQPQLSGLARAQQQADELTANLANTGQTGFLVIGHSMGGLVARRVGQQRPDLVTGVLTVGTPHQGAYVTLQSRASVTAAIQAVAAQMYADMACRSPNEDWYCFLVAVAYNWIPQYAAGFAEEALNQPAVQDLKPVQFVANPFITNLNAAAESFTRVGIQSYPAKRWVAFRLVGDGRHNPEETWGGRFYVKATSDAYTVAGACTFVSALVGRWRTFRRCFAFYDGLDFVDGVWDGLTAPRDSRTDGIVQGTSQVYPGSAVNYQIPGGDSHLGEPKSDRTLVRIRQAFDNDFRVPRP